MINYNDVVKIDTSRLDQEWADAASRYMEVVEAQVDASEQVDRLRNKMSVIEAKLAGEIRKDPGKYNIEKVTESSVKEGVSSHPDIISIQNQITDARRQSSLLSGMLTAMDHRRRALENLVELHLRNYQSEPRAKSPVSREAAAKLESQGTHTKVRIGGRPPTPSPAASPKPATADDIHVASQEW